MDVYNVKIMNAAENDLRDIVNYIAFELNAPTAALNMVRTIRKSIFKLKTDALLRPFVRDERLAAKGYRTLLIKNYMAFYIVNKKEKTVDVDRIIYSRRDWQNILLPQAEN